MAKNLEASVRARLLNVARHTGEDFQRILTRYAIERLLYRLSRSTHAARFVLKGATLFTVWTGKPHRATYDVDLLGHGSSSEADLLQAFSEVLAVEVDGDGMQFETSSLEVAPIREDEEYGGLRLKVTARLAGARTRVQVDVGFGDVITPSATWVEVPALLEFPAPSLRAYPRETVVAEKLEALVQLGMANSRLKDFYDLAVLSQRFEFEGSLLVQAIQATFQRRKTPLPLELPVGLTPDFAQDATKQAQWAGFVRKSGIPDAGSLADTVGVVAQFAELPLRGEGAGRWPAGGPWTRS